MNFDNNVLQVAIEDILPNRFQPRLAFDDDALEDLSISIKEHGIIQPLVLRRVGDKYEIVAGERRYKAATMAGLSSVPAVVSQIDDKKSAEVAVVENVQRKNLSSIEEAKSYKALLDMGYMSQEQLAKKMGVSQGAIANKLRLLNLCPEVQDAIMEGRISERHARTLLMIKDPNLQVEWLEKIIKERLTVRQLDDKIKNELGLTAKTMNIETVKETAKDIPNVESFEPITSQNTFASTPLNLGEKTQNRFFNNLESEKANMNMTEAINPLAQGIYMDIVDNNAETEGSTANVDIFDSSLTIPTPAEIDSLDFEPPKPANDFNDVLDKIKSIESELGNKYNITVSSNKLDKEITIVITVKEQEEES